MITPRENMLRFFRNEPCEWTPNNLDQHSFRPALVPDHAVRGMVMQQEPFTGEYGGLDMFGVDWIFDSNAGGSMEKAPLMDDITQWEKIVKFPNLDDIDWERCKQENAEFLKTDKLIQTTIYTGFFERLISFVGFSDAAVALIDEDQQEFVHKLFGMLADLYIDMIDRLHRHFNVELVEIHDDWGTQMSTMFSVATHKEMIAPYLKRVVDAAHKQGVYIELHSCGRIEKMIPTVIETGVDTWRGQAIVDKKMLVDAYGDQFKFGVEIRPTQPVDDDTAIDLVREAFEQWRGKNIYFAISRPFTPEQREKMYQFIRANPVL